MRKKYGAQDNSEEIKKFLRENFSELDAQQFNFPEVNDLDPKELGDPSKDFIGKPEFLDRISERLK